MLFDHDPEPLGMAEMAEMAEFVDDHVAEDRFGKEDKAPVEREVPLARAASPFGLLVPDDDAVVGDADLRRAALGLPLDHLRGLCADPSLDHLLQVSIEA